jgi:putative nucleotidyltransferase with HDIG domain
MVMIALTVDDIVRSISKLKPMPANVSQILRDINEPNVSIESLVGKIRLDQVLTAQVLQISNSASLGFSRTFSTLNEAIMQIGLLRLKSILMTSTATGMMRGRLTGYRYGAGELWQHSLTVGVASEWLAQALGYPNPEQAYVAGLLHDIGKLLLDQAMLSNYDKIADYVQKYQMPLWQVEEKLIGIDHAKVGGLIAEHWNFPVILVDAIRFHHVPSFARVNQSLPAIVNLANSFSADYQITNSALLSFELHPESLNILKISPHHMEKMKLKMMNSGVFPNFAKAGEMQ